MSLLRQSLRTCRPSLRGTRLRQYSTQAPLSQLAKTESAQSTAGPSHVPHDTQSTTSTTVTGVDPKPKRRRKTVDDGDGGKPKRASRKKKDVEVEDDEPRQNPLEPGQTELWLRSLETGITPSLTQDLEKLRRRPPKTMDADYRDKFVDLLDNVTRSFSAAQLGDFCRELHLPAYKRRKMDLAESILGHWGWKTPREVEMRIREETEILPQTFPIEQYHLFLVMGKDGSDLLRMSKQHNVYVALTRNPLALRVEGLRPSLKAVEKHLISVKANMIENVFEVPTKKPIRHDLLQRISRIANAFVENLAAEGQVRVCANDQQSLNAAKRLAMRAATELGHVNQLLLYQPPVHDSAGLVPTLSPIPSYSLYPFMSPRSLPWQLNTSGAFRWRKVGDWLGIDQVENVYETGGLSGQQGTVRDVNNEPAMLKDSLFQQLPEAPDASARHERIITAQTGHLLYISPQQGLRATIVPPVMGNKKSPEVLQWISENSTRRPSFIETLPADFLQSNPAQPDLIHRLTYNALDVTTPAEGDNLSPPTKTISFELMLQGHQSQGGSSISATSAISEFKCWKGSHVDVDLMMPDRPLDLRFTVKDRIAIGSGKEPTELKAYCDAIHNYLTSTDSDPTQPAPPLTLHYDGDDYILGSSHTVRQSKEQIPGVATQYAQKNVEVVTESLLDLESNQKSAVCLISCTAYESEATWTAFLANCDQVTSNVFKPKRSLNQLFF